MIEFPFPEAFWAASVEYIVGPSAKELQVSDFSTFDPAAFLDATTDQALERRAPIPAAEYLAVIQDLVVKPWASSKDPAKAGMKFDIKLVLDIPAEVQASLGTDSPTLTVGDSVMLDLTESNAIDWGKGKNGKLRMYRDATGQNTPGQAFSPR